MMRHLQILVFICSLVFINPTTSHSQIVINEYVSSNTLGLLDEHGETSDWIELFNSGPDPVNLYHYGLSDDPDDPFKWYFPSTLINPGCFVLVFASGESDRQAPYYWEALATKGDLWRYRINTSEPPVGWQDIGFDDSNWPEGPSGFGYGDGDDETFVEPCISASFRLVFNIDDLALVRHLMLHMDYDDGYVAWLNGVPLSRGNMAGTEDPAWNLPADDEREATMYRGGSLRGGYVSASALQAGENVLAVQVHNEFLESDDLTCIPYLTLGLRPFEGLGGRPPAPEVVARIIQLHTGYKLSVGGEILTLVDSDGVVLDQFDTGAMYSDVSRGRYPDGGSDWHYYTTPTPRFANPGSGSNVFSNPVFFSIGGGLFSGPLTVSLMNSDPAADIFYTIDGSHPDQSSIPYVEPLDIIETTVIRSVAISAGSLPSRPATASYILDVISPLPTVSFVTDPVNLWDPDYGIYVEENIYEEWERPMHLEVFEPDGTVALNQDAGVKLFGSYSRTRPQKSFRLISRSGYGQGSFDYPILPDKPLTEFSQLVWRNAGNDNHSTHLRDGLMHCLIADTGVDHLAYRPSRTYLNGEYWGILNIRERLDEDYIATNHGLDPDEIDIMKNFWVTPAGSSAGFWDLFHYFEENDLSDDMHFNHVDSLMAVDNYADYQIIEIFAANHDYGTNNIAWWRSQLPGGKWRWILYDTEAGMGLQTPVYENSLERALLVSGEGWPSPTFRTNILRGLTCNENFRASFINRFCDHLNTTFAPERTLAIAEEIAGGVAPEIPRHMDRWGRSPEWDERMDVVYDFLAQRPDYCRCFIQQQFELGSEATLNLAVQPAGAGRIKMTAAVVDSAFSGTYFTDVPMTLTAKGRPGFTFVGWSDSTLAAAESVTITLAADSSLTAFFVESVSVPSVVINEINYNSSDAFDTGDWVELHNSGTEVVDLSGWVFKDSNDLHCFTITEGTTLGPGGFLVLCVDINAFGTLFPEVENAMGNLGFGFSGSGELVRIFDNFGTLQDEVTYDDHAPWPNEPDGHGATLLLRDPLMDNALPESWEAGDLGGTPGAINFVQSPAWTTALISRLDSPFPNPCNPRTEIAFSLAHDQQVELSVYDVRGRMVKNIVCGKLLAGEHSRFWSGQDDSGRAMPSGTYVFRLKLDGLTLTRKTMLIR